MVTRNHKPLVFLGGRECKKCSHYSVWDIRLCGQNIQKNILNSLLLPHKTRHKTSASGTFIVMLFFWQDVDVSVCLRNYYEPLFFLYIYIYIHNDLLYASSCNDVEREDRVRKLN